MQTINFIVSLGQTRASAQVSCSIMEPRATRPNEGMLFIYVEFLPMCSQRFMNKVRFANHQKGGYNCNYCTICIPVWVSISNSDWQISKHFQKIREIVVCTNEKKSD